MSREQGEGPMGDEPPRAEEVTTPAQAGLRTEEQSDEEDDADDVDFNPLFLRESEAEESEDEEPQDDTPASLPQQALLDELGPPSAPTPSLLPFPQSPGGHPPIPALGPFSPGQSAFHPFGAPLTFSPNKVHGPSDGSLDLPASMRARHEVEVEAAEEGEEPVDGPAKRTRAQVSLAELTWEELDTFLQDDEDDFFPGIDDDEEYARFLASISALDEQPKEQERAGAGEGDDDEDEDEDDHDFVAEEEPDEEDEDAQQPLAGKRKLGRPRGSRRKKPPEAASRAAALRRPLAIKPASLEGRYQQVVCHMPSQDGRLRPVLMLKPVGAAPPPPPTVPRFTANQVGQLYCQLHEHVQLLVQLFCLTCLGPPASRALAAQCKTFLEALVATRERVLATKQTAFPARCFQPPCTRPSLHPHLLLDGHVTVAPWAPTVDGPVRSLLDVKPLHAVPDFLRDMGLVIAELDRKYPLEAGQGLPRALLKPLFPPNPNARPPQKPSETIRSILTNQHNPSPLPGAPWDPSLMGQPTEAGPQETGPESEGAPGFHSVLLTEPETDARPPRPLFMEEGADAATEPHSNDPSASADGQPPKGSVLVPRGRREVVKGTIGEELLKAAKPTLVAMALVAPIVSDLVQDLFHHAFNPALFPREPAPTARLRVFSEAEDELLALGMQEFNSDWERIRQRFLPTKSVHQIVVRVKNRCSSNAPDNVVKQMRHAKTAPLSAQEKFFVDEGILHHGYDWLQLAAYVPRADPALLPKLYRQACGLKPKTWKASHIRNERRKKQRQRLATQRARQEAAAELRELATDGPLRPAEADRDSSGTESDTPPERSESVPRPAVRGLFLAETVTQAPPAQPEPAVFQHPPGATVATPPPTAPTRPFWMTGMATQQPPAKRGKGGPAPGRGQSVHPANSAHRPLARPPLRPLATQALPFPGPRPMLQTPAASVLHKPVPPSFPVSAPTAHPPAPVGAPLLAVHQNPSNAASSGPATRTVVIRPQARRATPVSAVPQSGPRPAGPSAGPPARGATTSLPAEARSQAPAPAVTQLRRSTEPGQEPQQAQRPAPAGTLLSMQTTSIAEMPSSTIGPRPETSEPLPTPVANSGGRTAPSASGGPPPPVGRVGIAQQTRPGPAQETRHSSPRIQIEKSQHAADLERLAVPVAAQPRAPPAAPSASAPASPKPWKTRQRQPKAVKAQQKAREAEERRRKQAAKDAEKRSAQEAQKAAQEAAAAESGAANCSTGGSGRGPSSTHRPPKVTVHKLPGARGNGLPPPGAARVTHITTGHGNQGSRRPTGSGVGAPPSGPQSVAHPHTWAGPRPPSLAHPPPLVPPDLLNQVRPQGSLPERPHPLAHGHVRQAAAVHASTHPRPGASLHPPAYPDALHSAAGNGSLAGAWSGEEARQRGAVPAMERDELTDSDEEDTWQRNGLPYARTGGLATGTLSADRDALQSVKGHALGQEVEGHAAGEGREDEERRYAEPEGGLGAAMEAATGGRHGASAGMPEMERDELTDSDDEDHVAERGARGGSPGWGRRGSEAAAREVEMERDELTDSDEDAAGSGGEEDGGEDEGHAGHDLIRGFLMEQDELTESDEDQGEEDWGGGPGAATAGTPEVGGRRSEAPYGVFQQRNENSQASGGLTASLSPVQMATAEGNLTGEESNGPRQVGAQGGGALWERSVTFERDELEDSDDDEKGGKDGAGGRFEQDQVTESDDDDS